MPDGSQHRAPQQPRGPHPQYGYGYGPQVHDTYILQQPRAASDTSITRLTVPLILVGSFGVFLVVATYAATSQFADIKHAIDKLTGKVDSLTGELSGRITRVEQDAAARARAEWTKRDHETWCAKAERANQALGWTCGENGETAARFAPQVNGWSARGKP